MNWDLDPDLLWLYVLATILSTIAVFIMFRESRERKRAMDEAKREIDATMAAENEKKAVSKRRR